MSDLIDPYIEIYEHVFKLSEALGYSTFDYIPDETASYPFVFVGEQFSEDYRTKTLMRGETNLIIHVYSHERQRRTINTMMAFLNQAINNINYTDHFKWEVINNKIHSMYENDKSNPLVHGIFDITLNFVGKGE